MRTQLRSSYSRPLEQGSRIYYDFSPEVAWIKKEVARDVQRVRPSGRSVARFYTEERLNILRGRESIRVTDQRMGRPIPYLAFWFADALGLDNRRRRLAGLSLVYNSIAVTMRDDIADSRLAKSPENSKLARFWSKKYTETLREIFLSDHEFRKATSWADAEWKRFEEWSSIPLGNASRHPFSEDFLKETSRYYVASTLPTLVAISHAAGKEMEVPRIKRFMTMFSMGWKIFDDLMDWEGDLAARELNRSSILIYVWNRTDRKKEVDRMESLSWFLDNEFVEEAYGAMIAFFLEAQRAVRSLRSSYLDRFMEELIGFQTDKRESLLGAAALTLSDLNEGLASALGPASLSDHLKRKSQPSRR
jgi:hypothetical protein